MKRVGSIAYELKFPNELATINPVFHVSMLKKFISGHVYIIPVEGLGVTKHLSYEEVPVEILDHQVNKMRNKEVSSIKVLWRNFLVEVQHGRLRPT